VLVLWAWVGLHSSFAATGPFADFPGNWSGTGTLRGPEKTERIRCSAGYRPLGSTGHQINLQLRCDGDSYKFDLAGQFQAEGNDISGNWTERTRNVGGTVIGNARGDRLQFQVESSAFSATMYMTTRGGSQSVSIDALGGGQNFKVSITLRKR
jgi:hypothetical protein